MLLYEGPSTLDGVPIVVIARGIDDPSKNTKTGPMVQTYILVAGIAPRAAIKSQADSSICGNCPARGRWCYAPLGPAAVALETVWKNYRAGKYEKASPAALRNRPIRFGTYGDPAAAPTALWARLADVAAVHTGYTHQWRTCDQELRRYCMASVDSLEEQYQATSMGWRTYRVTKSLSDQVKNEVRCPHYNTGLQCITCGYCNGGLREFRGNVVVAAHGTKANDFASFTAGEGHG